MLSGETVDGIGRIAERNPQQSRTRLPFKAGGLLDLYAKTYVRLDPHGAIVGATADL